MVSQQILVLEKTVSFKSFDTPTLNQGKSRKYTTLLAKLFNFFLKTFYASQPFKAIRAKRSQYFCLQDLIVCR